MGTTQGSGGSGSPEVRNEWAQEVQNAGHRRQAIRDRFYSERAALMFKPRENAQANTNYADEALKTPADDKFKLKTFDALKDSGAQVIEASVPEGKTLSHYLLDYFRQAYGTDAAANKSKIWQEVYLSIYFLVHYQVEHFETKDAQGNAVDNVRPLNVDMVRAGDKLVIQDGRLSILHPVKNADGTTTWYQRVRGVPLRPTAADWTPPDDANRQKEDVDGRVLVANAAAAAERAQTAPATGRH